MERIRQLGSFAFIGGCSTGLYVLLALLFTVHWHWPAGLSSAIAYALCGLVSYFGNRALFGSTAPIQGEASRFVVSSLFSYSIATGIPLVLTDIMHWDARIAIAIVFTLVPVLNFVILSQFVFSRPRGEPTP